jgi:hypothetical protein
MSVVLLGQSIEEDLGLPDLGILSVDPVLLIGGAGLLLLLFLGRGLGSGIKTRRRKVKRRRQARRSLRAALEDL